MRAALCLALLVALATAARAQSPHIQRIEIVEFGIYQAVATGTSSAAPGTAAGILRNVELTLRQKTATIPARLGVSFGYRYRIVGTPANAPITLRDVNIVPPPGLRNPKTGNVLMQEEALVNKKIGETTFSSYTFENEWELLPGVWTFQLWDGGRKLAEQKFTLVKP